MLGLRRAISSARLARRAVLPRASACGTRGVQVLGICLVVHVSPAAAQVLVRAFDQARSTYARADAVSRADSVVGFGNYDSAIHVTSLGTPILASASALQSSGIFGDSTLASGEARANTQGNDTALARATSDYVVHFLIAERTGFTLMGRAETRATVVADAAGEAHASIVLRHASGVVAEVQSDCLGACDHGEDLLASGVLVPGTYTLEAHAQAMGASGAQPSAQGNRTGRFALIVWFDGPIVGTQSATWAALKSMYR